MQRMTFRHGVRHLPTVHTCALHIAHCTHACSLHSALGRCSSIKKKLRKGLGYNSLCPSMGACACMLYVCPCTLSYARACTTKRCTCTRVVRTRTATKLLWRHCMCVHVVCTLTQSKLCTHSTLSYIFAHALQRRCTCMRFVRTHMDTSVLHAKALYVRACCTYTYPHAPKIVCSQGRRKQFHVVRPNLVSVLCWVVACVSTLKLVGSGGSLFSVGN